MPSMSVAEVDVRVEDLDIGRQLAPDFLAPRREELLRPGERVHHRSDRCLSAGPT